MSYNAALPVEEMGDMREYHYDYGRAFIQRTLTALLEMQASLEGKAADHPDPSSFLLSYRHGLNPVE